MKTTDDTENINKFQYLEHKKNIEDNNEQSNKAKRIKNEEEKSQISLLKNKENCIQKHNRNCIQKHNRNYTQNFTANIDYFLNKYIIKSISEFEDKNKIKNQENKSLIITNNKLLYPNMFNTVRRKTFKPKKLTIRKLNKKNLLDIGKNILEKALIENDKKTLMKIFIDFNENNQINNLYRTESYYETFENNFSILKQTIKNLKYKEYNYELSPGDYFITR